MNDKVKKSYKQSLKIYDDIITHKKWWSKLHIKLFWKGVDDNEIALDLLEKIPDNFSDKLLDVPVGTAVFTFHKYMKMKNANITCLDYSSDMLAQAQKRFVENGIENVLNIEGDVSKMPFNDDEFDIVLSMNGFHVFPHKEGAFAEIHRVLKPGGNLFACFYIKGESKISDILVSAVLSKKGWFSPPFDTRISLKRRIENDYVLEDFQVRGSIVSLVAIKRK